MKKEHLERKYEEEREEGNEGENEDENEECEEGNKIIIRKERHCASGSIERMVCSHHERSSKIELL